MSGTPKMKDAFSLVRGGPMYRLLVRAGLVLPGTLGIARRAIFFALVAWLPLLLLSAAEGLAVGNAVTIPFLHDPLAYARFLIAVPLLIIAERLIEPKIAVTAHTFADSGLLDEMDQGSYRSAITEAERWRDSAWGEVLVLGLAYLGTLVWLAGETTVQVSTWSVHVSASGERPTAAGWWYYFVSIPIQQFLIYRWLWRIVIWSRFLWRMSRLDLCLMPTHPDRAAGLGFLAIGHRSFGSIAFPVGVIWSAAVHRAFLYHAASLETIRAPSAVLAVLNAIVFLGPLLIFMPKLRAARVRGVLEYGRLALQYTQSFDRKWVRGGAPEGEELLGSGDIQSLADMGGSFERIENTRIVPFSVKTLLDLTISVLAPMLPLLLLVMSWKEILEKLLGMLH